MLGRYSKWDGDLMEIATKRGLTMETLFACHNLGIMQMNASNKSSPSYSRGDLPQFTFKLVVGEAFSLIYSFQ